MTDRLAAAVLYAMLTVLAFGVFSIFLSPFSATSWSTIVTVQGALSLVAILASLGVLSFVVASILVRQRSSPNRLSVLVLAIAGFLPILAFGWSVIAALIWLLPLFFAWRASRPLPRDA